MSESAWVMSDEELRASWERADALDYVRTVLKASFPGVYDVSSIVRELEERHQTRDLFSISNYDFLSVIKKWRIS